MKKSMFILMSLLLTGLWSCSNESATGISSGEGAGAGTEANYERFDAVDLNFETAEGGFEKKGEKTKALVSGANSKPMPQGGKSIEKKIIKDGTITLRSQKVELSKIWIDSLLKKHRGYYQSENLDNNNQRISYDLSIRVPSQHFEHLLNDLQQGTEECMGKSISARDVTEEFVDIEGRLATKRQYLQQYRLLLSKAASMKDILALEENIRVLQEEIDSQEGRLNYLRDQVNYSTLSITLYKDKEFVYKPQEQDQFSERIKKSLANGWQSVINGFLWILEHWSILLVLTVVFLSIRKWRRNKAVTKI